MKYSGLLICAVLTIGLHTGHMAEQATEITNIFVAYPKAVEVKVPDSKGGLDWLVGEWACVDRALRLPPSDDQLYAYLSKMRFKSDCILRSQNYSDGLSILSECSFNRYRPGAKEWNAQIVIEFNKTGFLFDVPYTDGLILMKDPADQPKWFILKHEKTNDMLLFQRQVQRSAEKATDPRGKPQNAEMRFPS